MKMDTNNMQLLSAKEVALRLNISNQTVRKLITTKELKGIRVGNVFKVPLKELEFYVDRHST